VKSDLEIVQALAARVGLGDVLAGTAREWKQRMLRGKLEPRGVTLEDLERGPVKNPLAPSVVFDGRKFLTPNGRANLIREAAAPGARPSAQFPLLLASLSTPRSQSSQWARAPKLPLELVVHPEAAGGVADGAIARLESEVGSMQVRIRHDDRQRRDVALLPKGGHRTGGACANVLVRASVTDLGEGGALYDEPVRVVPLTES
jgi:anaerobic selenocysteine-containing dehydrogenase